VKLTRLIAGLGAPLIGAATLSQGWLSVEESMAQGRTLAHALWIYLCYFTVLTNVFVTAVLARAALKPDDRRALNAPRVELMAATSILFVGAVYNLLLASQWDPQGLRKFNDVILHSVSPLLFTLFWLARPRGDLALRDAAFASLWPMAYTLYGLTRGAFDGYYPYFFMNPATTALPQLLLNVLALLAAFAAGALVLIGADRVLRRASSGIARGAR
jgi:hypothetical protein